MTEPQSVSINLDHILEILRSGVRRADVFMGIGLNAASHDPPISHVLAPDGHHHINLVKEQLGPDEQAHVAAEFGKWVRSNGLRELIETFSIYLDRLYVPLFILHKGASNEGAKLPSPQRLEHLGIADKIDVLASLLAVSDADRRVLRTLNQARNCYAHRRGVVGERDLDPDTGTMVLHWNAFQIEVKELDGTVVVEEAIFNRVFPAGGIVQLRVVERLRTFSAGAELVLDKRDLKEICLSTLSIGQRLLRETVEIARKAGVLRQDVDDSLDDPRPV